MSSVQLYENTISIVLSQLFARKGEMDARSASTNRSDVSVRRAVVRFELTVSRFLAERESMTTDSIRAFRADLKAVCLCGSCMPTRVLEMSLKASGFSRMSGLKAPARQR